MSDQDTRGFLFDWSLLLVARLHSGRSVVFSKVFLEDYDLMDKGADDRAESIADKLKKLGVKELGRREKFLLKIEELGFVHNLTFPGSEVIISKMDEWKAAPAIIAVEDETQLNSDAKDDSGRVPVCYEDLSLFDDVHYKLFKKSSNAKRINYKLQSQASGSSESLTAPQELPSSSSDERVEDKFNFDFEFDSERDAKLVAMKANKILKNDKEIQKYWFQRYRLFSKLNEGILMDREGWFSVTPERIAEHIADRLVDREDCVILDGFTGVGGNAIQFALRGALVYAIDIDPVKLRCALKNAQIYGVSDRITFICGDYFHVAKSLIGSRSNSTVDASGDGAAATDNKYGIDAVFLSPPWGGPTYLNAKVYDLEANVEPNGIEIFKAAKQVSPNICYFLPRNTAVNQLIHLAGEGGRVEIEHSELNGKVKTLSAYYGNLITS